MDRRSALKIFAASCVAPLVGASEGTQEAPSSRPAKADSRPARMPAIFLAHGSPYLLDDAKWRDELAAWARAMPKPKAVLMVSAHWEQKPATLGATRTVPLVYDFYGFPERYYSVKYAAPGAPDLATRVRSLLGKSQPVADAPERGLDHGAYVPMVAMYPDADVPVLQVSLPTLATPALFEMGRALAPLREEGVLIVGSGFLTHNLGAMVRPGAAPPSWSKEFDSWAEGVLSRRDSDSLLDYRYLAPGVKQALPTHEHFVPVVVALGAAIDAPGAVTFPITGFTGGLTRRSVQFA
jgi:4,5-DOPA dioxygenase extradiol